MNDFQIQIVQGDDVDIVLSVYDKSDTAIDLSSATAITFKVQKAPEGDTYISKTLGSGITVGSPTNELTITLTDVDTADDSIDAGEYVFELQVTDAAGKISTIRDFNDQLGKFIVLQDLDDT